MGDGGGAPGRSAPRAEVLTTETPVYRLCSFLSRWLLRLFCAARIEGVERLPLQGGLLLVANHASFLDILLLGGFIPRHVAFVARDTLARWRWLGYVMRQCGAVLVRRGQSDRAALRGMVEHLRQGDCVAVYPEGTRTRDGRLQAFRSGALSVARWGGVPILPLGIVGSYEAWPRHRRFPRPARITLRIGEPIDSEAPDALERAREAVAALIGQAAPPGGDPEPTRAPGSPAETGAGPAA